MAATRITCASILKFAVVQFHYLLRKLSRSFTVRRRPKNLALQRRGLPGCGADYPGHGLDEDDVQIITQNGFNSGRTKSLPPRVSKLPEMAEPSLLLSESIRSSVHASLPLVSRGRRWVLLYSTWKHGMSLLALYRRSALCPGPCLLVAGDKKGAVFGGLLTGPLRPDRKPRSYRGTEDTFVFTNVSGEPVVYHPTGANRYYILCATDSLALGGGGNFALYLDGDLLGGSSASSVTFGNSCLAWTQDFELKEVELWGFVHTRRKSPRVSDGV